MSDNKKYYYMRLKENFFDSEQIVILESMPDGILYSNILLKMYLKSLKDYGKLMLNEFIPYNPQMIATVTRHQVGTVEKALDVFQKLGLIEILDNGSIYMMDIQNYIGKGSSEADRVRAYRKRIEEDKKLIGETERTNVTTNVRQNYPEIEKEIKKEKDIEIEKEIEKEPLSENPPTEVASSKPHKILKSFPCLNGIEDLELLDELQAFADMRKEIKAKMTDRAMKLLVGKLQNLSGGDVQTMIAILDQSIMNSWKSVYELKADYNGAIKSKVAQELDESYKMMSDWANQYG